MTTTYKLTETFEANDKKWKTDAETLQLMREFRDDGNKKMLALVFNAGVFCGRIVEVK